MHLIFQCLSPAVSLSPSVFCTFQYLISFSILSSSFQCPISFSIFSSFPQYYPIFFSISSSVPYLLSCSVWSPSVSHLLQYLLFSPPVYDLLQYLISSTLFSFLQCLISSITRDIYLRRKCCVLVFVFELSPSDPVHGNYFGEIF